LNNVKTLALNDFLPAAICGAQGSLRQSLIINIARSSLEPTAIKK